MHKKVALVLLIAGLACELGCNKDSAQAAAPVPTASTAAPIASQPIAAEDPIAVSGPLIVEHQIDVTAQRDGIVTRIQAEPGIRVKAGEVLATLDGRQISADLEAARAKTRSIAADLKNWEADSKVMESDYQRSLKLFDAHVISPEQLQHAQYKAESDKWDIVREQEMLTNAQQNERSLELELEKTRIRAPFEGLVARRYIREGQQVNRGDRLFWVTAEAPLRLRFTLPERFLGHLKKGQALPLSSPDIPDATYTARIIELSPVVDPSSGTIEVLAQLVGPSGQLKPGMTARITLENAR